MQNVREPATLVSCRFLSLQTPWEKDLRWYERVIQSCAKNACGPDFFFFFSIIRAGRKFKQTHTFGIHTYTKYKFVHALYIDPCIENFEGFFDPLGPPLDPPLGDAGT